MSSAQTSARPLPVAVTSAVVAEAPVEDEIRTSNGVDGFRYSRVKAVLYTLKIVLAVPLLPFWPFFVANEAGDWSLATKKYWKTLTYCIRTIWVHVALGSFVRLLKYNLLMGPDEVKARIAQRRGACTRCAKCCKQYDCVFLGKDEQTSEFYCKVYQTDYWYYGTCGRYPLDQRDIDDHACPGFSFEGTAG